MAQVTKSINRVDGRAKVTGKARYTNDIQIDNLAYGYLLSATITKGKIASINTQEAARQKGVIKIFTHLNMPRLYRPAMYISPFDPSGDSGQQVHVPLQDEHILYDLQYVAVVVAETFEIAQEAAALIEVTYEADNIAVEEHPNEDDAEELEFLYGIIEANYHRGKPEAAFENSPIQLEQEYYTQTMHHNPMERHGTTAVWERGSVTIYEPTAWVYGHKKGVAEMLGIPQEKVRVISKFIGGAFGGKGLVAPHTAIAAAVSKEVNRPVRLELTRKQLFGCVGLRSATSSKVKLGAEKDGKVNSISIVSTGESPHFYPTAFETSVVAPRLMYSNEHMLANMQVSSAHISGPVPMRSPGEASGMFLLESVMDELSYTLDMDPLKLRRKNHADTNLETNLPWSSKYLLECYAEGAKRFGWENREPSVKSMKKGDMLIGYGMASACYPTFCVPASVKARLNLDGQLEIIVATQEIGTGTNTIIAQIAADGALYPIQKITAQIGDTNYPKAPPTVAAFTAASVGTAVKEVAEKMKAFVLQMARRDSESPLHEIPLDQMTVKEGVVTANGKSDQYLDILKRSGRPFFETMVQTNSYQSPEPSSAVSFGANFVEVEVDPITSWAKINRVVGVFDCGKIINPKTAQSQLIGGSIFAIGMAMQEASERDLTTGRYLNADLGGYHMPVQADVPELDLSFLPYEDEQANPMAIKSVGELGGVGLQAAIMNAIYHATGIRIRSLPYKPEKLLKMAR